jgi:outer membrane protein assembly factor BamB
MDYSAIPYDVTDLVFVGFNSQVIALHRETGETLWTWKAPKGRSQMVAVMLDGDILIVSVNGYMYGVNPIDGDTLWHNPLTGLGFGIPSLCSLRSNSGSAGAAAIIAQQQAAAT